MGGVTTRPTAAEHRYSVAGKEERRKERSKRKGKEREEGKETEGCEQAGLQSESKPGTSNATPGRGPKGNACKGGQPATTPTCKGGERPTTGASRTYTPRDTPSKQQAVAPTRHAR